MVLLAVGFGWRWPTFKFDCFTGDFKWPTTDEKNTAQSGGKIKCIHFHKDYKKKPSRSYTNQLAIVELENDFKETDYVAPIRVCTKKDKVNQTHVLKSAGMGNRYLWQLYDDDSKLSVTKFARLPFY